MKSLHELSMLLLFVRYTLVVSESSHLPLYLTNTSSLLVASLGFLQSVGRCKLTVLIDSPASPLPFLVLLGLFPFWLRTYIRYALDLSM